MQDWIKLRKYIYGKWNNVISLFFWMFFLKAEVCLGVLCVMCTPHPTTRPAPPLLSPPPPPTPTWQYKRPFWCIVSHLLICIASKLPLSHFFHSSSGMWLPESLMRFRSQSGGLLCLAGQRLHRRLMTPPGSLTWLLVFPLSNYNNKSSTAGMFHGIF